MRFNLNIKLLLFPILLMLTGCASYVENSKAYLELVEKKERTDKENTDLKHDLRISENKIDSLRGENASIELQIKHLEKGGKPIKPKKEIARNAKKITAPTTKTYKGTESMHHTDIKQNKSFKVNLTNQDFSAYIVQDAKDIQFFWKNDKKKLIRNLKKLQEIVALKNKELLFGMNAGIFNPDRTPTGLFIKEGKELVALNTKNAHGNFFLKPNGIFIIEKSGLAHVMETTEFQKKKEKMTIENATQSGPMLVINGKIHPVFVETSTNLNIRNGVGVDKDGKVVFLITEKPVNLYTFASIFKEHFNCDNALYLDGAISDAFIPGIKKYGLDGNFGPLIGVLNQR